MTLIFDTDNLIFINQNCSSMPTHKTSRSSSQLIIHIPSVECFTTIMPNCCICKNDIPKSLHPFTLHAFIKHLPITTLLFTFLITPSHLHFYIPHVTLIISNLTLSTPPCNPFPFQNPSLDSSIYPLPITYLTILIFIKKTTRLFHKCPTIIISLYS